MKIALIGDSLTEGRPGVSFYNILKEEFPNITFVNLGKSGETVKSLYMRLLETKLEQDYDLTFLWIGVNDVYSKLLSVQAQPVTQNLDEFKDYYEKVLELIIGTSKKVVTVSLAIVGENTENTHNNEIKELNALLQNITRNYSNVSFLDIHPVFLNHLSNLNCSNYISTKVMRVIVDVLFYKKPSRVDKISKERGLHLTMDGVHLNSAGAEIVAGMYASEIKRSLEGVQ